MKNRHFVIFGLLPLALFLVGAAAVSRDLVIQNAANAPGLTIIKPGSQTSNLIEAYIGSGSKLSLSRDGNMALNGYLSLSGATNRLTVADGSLKLDGTAVGGNSGDPFVITSELADNATNVALVVDTDATWQANAHLLRLKNNGTNAFAFRAHGHLSITGPSYSEVTGTSPGDTNYFDIYADSTSAYFQVWGEESGSLLVDLSPMADDGTTPHTLNTAAEHTTGYLFELQNDDSVKLGVDYRGALKTQAGAGITPANASATGTAGTIVWDSGFIYVCVAENTWKRVAIATW